MKGMSYDRAMYHAGCKEVEVPEERYSRRP